MSDRLLTTSWVVGTLVMMTHSTGCVSKRYRNDLIPLRFADPIETLYIYGNFFSHQSGLLYTGHNAGYKYRLYYRRLERARCGNRSEMRSETK